MDYRKIFASVAGVGLVVSPAFAATHRVPLEYATIQAGLDASVAPDTVLVAPGTYTDSETRDIGTPFPWTACAFLVDGVTLRSEGGPAVTVMDMQQGGPQPVVVSGRQPLPSGAVVEGFTITGPAASGGAYGSAYSRLTFRDCIFRDLDARPSSGAGVNANTSLLLERCEFVNCVAFIGGAVYHGDDRLEMYDCVVRDCGNIGVKSSIAGGPNGSSHIEGCTFEDCWSTDGTGALFIDNHWGGSTVRDCVFVGNVGGGARGGVSVGGNNPVPKVVEGNLFWNNHAAGPNGSGGGLDASGPTIVRNNTFYGNTAVNGAAVDLSDGPMQLLNNVIVNCLGSYGGAVYFSSSTLSSMCNVFWDNPPGYTPGPTDRIVDPLLCDPAGGDFRLRGGSPCLPEGSIGCGLIGAFGEGCGVISVDPWSWGKIKAAYRGEGGSRP
jgi:hypothetical protein